MEITHLGHSSFKLRTKTATLVTDPYDPEMVGIKFPKVEADIVTVSHKHKDHNNISAVEGTPLVVAGPGEYEIKGVKIAGIATFHDDSHGEKRGLNTVYRIEMDGISIIHAGDLGHKLDDKELELLDGVDVLMIPVGGTVTVDVPQAVEIISKLEPKIIIPMHYKTAGINPKIFGDLSGVSVFLKEMGKEGISPLPKLNITKDKLPVEPSVVVLE